MIGISVKLDEKSIAEAQRILRGIPRAWPRIARRGINRTVDSAATDLKRETGKQITLKKSEIAKGIIKRKATISNLYGNIGTTAYRPGIIRFPGTKQTKKGVTYRISRMRGRQIIESGFLQTIPVTGHRGAFKRKTRSRLPIVEAKGPSIWGVIVNAPGLLDGAQKRAGEKLGKNISDQVGVELRRWRKK